MGMANERAKAAPAEAGFDAVSKQEAAAYLADLLEALETFAHSKDMRFLGQILALAVEEAARNR
ncbi:MAG: hypothetical protein KKE02_15145 [Alphaproteobacteria bacterium]|nr:hypothetical protein [Alphaproteobacteria bacterium]MBU1516197.1 hypothetical protein [Alphaproteobacteria bacterium]MBU2093507.1 hypothetical protein [Alphaproteobacteria bacterium]MBU2152355.1 hypothetical protein [Alphaproteobacteria bacterium]MBU2308169.1 hypothetical protein [Alphaproteobacteria bacterium]